MLRLPPPVWAFIFLLIVGVASVFTPWHTPHEFRSVPLGATLVVAGFALAVWAAMLFRREGTEILPTSATNKKLVVRGPFRFTRNPMYLGLVVASLGIAFWVGDPPMFAVPILVFATANWVHIPFEEAKMRRQFGEAFDDYCRRTRRWI
jgi:protein-S-isoprenylcysteine O-methyltransferase Ste14